MKLWVIQNEPAALAKLRKGSAVDKGTTRLNGRHCRFWQQSTRSGGYGRLSIEGRDWDAHRLSYRLATGEHPANNVCHACDHPSCVEPVHLWSGTQKQNLRDCIEKGRHGSHRHPERFLGEKNQLAKVTTDKVREIRAEYSRGGIEQAELGAKHGITQATVSKIVTRRTWAHIK